MEESAEKTSITCKHERTVAEMVAVSTPMQTKAAALLAISVRSLIGRPLMGSPTPPIRLAGKWLPGAAVPHPYRRDCMRKRCVAPQVGISLDASCCESFSFAQRVE